MCDEGITVNASEDEFDRERLWRTVEGRKHKAAERRLLQQRDTESRFRRPKRGGRTSFPPSKGSCCDKKERGKRPRVGSF